MVKLNCLIADDEKLAREVLENYIGRVTDLNLIGVFNNSFEVYNFLENNKVDVLFLDINMPQLNGLDLIRSLKQPPRIVLTTAYREYAIEAFELNAIDYLIKPFSFERFLQAVNKLMSAKYSDLPEQSVYIDLKVDRKNVRVSIHEILYIEAIGNYVKVYCTEKVFITYLTLRSMLVLLPPSKFRQIHKSYIVATEKILKYTASKIILNNIELPVGRSFRNQDFKL